MRKKTKQQKDDLTVITLSQVKSMSVEHHSTGHKAVDALFGGKGLASGSVNLMSGPPGIGKSTLLSYIADLFSELGKPVLYLSLEESLEQMKLRTDRLKVKGKRFHVSEDQDCSIIIKKAEHLKPAIIIIDSIQLLETTIRKHSHIVDNAVHHLKAWAKHQAIPLMLVGHYTKKGKIAGSNNMQHMVDAIFEISRSDSSNEKIVKALKNRFGSTDTELRYIITDKGIDLFSEKVSFREATHNPFQEEDNDEE
jgi:DNA repair protein RadA/Sms